MPKSGITVYGAYWCPYCQRSKKFLSEQFVDYTWIDIEQDKAAENYVLQLNHGKRIIPTILFPDGSLLVEPTNVHKPKDNKTNPEFKALWEKIGTGATLDERKAAFAAAQRIAYDDVMVIPMGTMPKVQGVRANVENFKPYYIPRMSNVWLKN